MHNFFTFLINLNGLTIIIKIPFQDKLDAENFTNIPNLNWLIHMAYARRDFNYCKDVIGHQFSVTYDHEYLYFVKVSSINGKVMTIILNKTWFRFHNNQGLIARDEGNLNEALQSLQKAIELNPESIENLKEIGKTL